MSVHRTAARLTKSPSHSQHHGHVVSISRSPYFYQRFSSTVASDSKTSQDESSATPMKTKDQRQPKKKEKTQAELDKELQLRMQGLSGDGGEAGVEYEDGQPVSMKRSVKDNMFRYI